MPSYHFYTLDVFTNQALQGNPLAVIGDAADLSDVMMQKIAAEFNLSETVFLCPPKSPEALAFVRIFTPQAELPFAGHPLIGTAILLARLSEQSSFAPITLECAAGLVRIDYQQREQGLFARLSAPAMPYVKQDFEPEALAAHLGLRLEQIISPQLAISGPQFVIAQTDSASLAQLVPPQKAFAAAPQALIYLFALQGQSNTRDQAKLRIESRCFAAHLSIPEDPATGAAAVALSAYLASKNQNHQTEQISQAVSIEQGRVMGRPSYLFLDYCAEQGQVTQCKLSGQAIGVSEGDFTLG